VIGPGANRARIRCVDPASSSSAAREERHMASINQDPIILGKDLLFGDENESIRGPAQPVSQDDIEELLYNEEIPVADRVARLQQLRDDLGAQETLDFADNDPGNLLGEIDRALTRLAGDGLTSEAPLDLDPADHRETLAPDDDVREAIEAADEESVEDDLFGVEEIDAHDPTLPEDLDPKLH
jgi:hypothetical protein